MQLIKKFFLLLSGWLILVQSYSQVSIPGQYLDRIDKMNDSTTLSFYSSIQNNSASHFSWLDPLFKTTFNSTYPRGYNDGSVWKGRGITAEGHAGFYGRKGKFSYTFLPVGYYSQNSNFYQGDNAPDFSYQFSNRIDWVQQYGNGSFMKLHPGQSEISFRTGQFIAAISTQNYSLGPSIYNPIILSRQAGGFPNIRVGIAPTEINITKKSIGKIETNFIFGLLKESDYFDEDESNDQRYINILSFAYSPSFLPELTLGFNRSLYKQTQFFEPTDLISTLFIFDNGVINGDTISVNDTFDQLASITMDWNFPQVGFRAYAEFSKNDFTSDGAGIRPTSVEPEHTRAYTIGFEKELTSKKGRTVRIGYEHTNLSRNSAFLWRPTPSYYTHGVNRNGYSNDGQIIGAGIGPGGNSDHLNIKIEYTKFKIGLLFQRIEHNRDFFVVNITNANLHDIEYSINGFFQKEFKPLTLYLESTVSHNYNKYYIADKANFSLSLGFQFKIN